MDRQAILDMFKEARGRAWVARTLGQGGSWARVADRWAKVEAILAMALEAERPEEWIRFIEREG